MTPPLPPSSPTRALPGLQFATHADAGARMHQDDAFLADPALGLFAVADGMGGMAAARHAADLVLETLRELVGLPTSGTAPEHLAAAVEGANGVLFPRTDAAARDWDERRQGAIREYNHEIGRWMGVGTTIVALLFAMEDTAIAVVAHVGDSRAYRLRRWTLELLTEDHRLRDDARRAGISEAEIAEMPDKVITAALGVRATVAVRVTRVEVEPGDLFLLCSDGLSDELGREEIERILLANLDDLDAAARALVARAVAPIEPSAAGGAHGSTSPDNVTVLLVHPVA